MRATIQITIRRLPDGQHVADAELSSEASAATSTLAADEAVAIDPAALLTLGDDAAAYGRALAAALFAPPALRDAWLQARAYAAAGDLQLRLRLDARDSALHALRWETLRDPQGDQPIALRERVRLVRDLDSADLAPVIIPPRPALRALVVVSNPSDLGRFGLAEVDVDGEVARARAALGDIPTTILGDHAGAAGRATLANIAAQLREASPIVLVVAHGTLRDGQPLLWLEREGGLADPVDGADVVAAVERLSSRPLLLVLAACRGAGAGYGDTLGALGPGLARVGVPAVLAFQGDVAMSTVKVLLPALLTELRRDGQVDRALAAARAALGEARPWWQAVLWLRTDGRLWREGAAAAAPPPAQGGGIQIGGSVGTVQVLNISGGSVGSIIGSQTNHYGAPPDQGSPGGSDPAAALRQRLEQHRATLGHYLGQLAISGSAHVRPEVMHGIYEARQEIGRIKAQLRAMGQAVEDQLDDEGA